jgi:hypothetical protein
MNDGDIIHIPPGEMTGQIRNRLPRVNEGMTILAPGGQDFDKIKDNFMTRKRMKYGAMRAHMEMAATALATGATYKIAAAHAGVSTRQVKKYMQDPDFRERIVELRSTLMSKIQGKIVNEIDRRTEPELIQGMETMDVLRILDRTTGKASLIGEVNVVNNSYEAIFNAIIDPNARSESADFPAYESTYSELSEGDTPVDEPF